MQILALLKSHYKCILINVDIRYIFRPLKKALTDGRGVCFPIPRMIYDEMTQYIYVYILSHNGHLTIFGKNLVARPLQRPGMWKHSDLQI